MSEEPEFVSHEPQQALAPEEEDQVGTTRAYLKEHHLNDLFVHFLQLLLYYRPENPRAFLVEEIQKIRQQKVSSSLFTDKDLETMFDLIDVTRQRAITITQLRNTCRNLSTTGAGGPSADENSAEEAVLEAAIAQAADEKGMVSLENFKAVLSMLVVTKNVWSA